MEAPRLLLTISPSEEVDAELALRLPKIPVLYARDVGSQAHPSVEAALVTQLDRHLPGLTPEMLPNLQFAQTVSTGVDGFPFPRFGPQVRVAGNVGAHAPFVAEHAVALVLALAKNVVVGDRMVREGRLRPVPNSLFLEGRRALIVGFGAIGHGVAHRLRGLGMEIEGITHQGLPDPEADRMAPIGELEEAIGRADVVVNCLPLSRDTLGLFSEAQLGRMKPEAIFVNVGRARTVDAAALTSFLERRPDARIGLDVWWDEDFPNGRLGLPVPMDRYPNFVGSPHSAGATAVTRTRALDYALQNLARFFNGEMPLHVVDRNDLSLADPSS